MTLMDTNSQYFRPRLVLWPRGRFLFNSNFSGFALHESTDAVQLALRFLWHQFSNQRSRLVTFGDWLKVAKSKMAMSNDAAFAVFVSAQQLFAVPGMELLVNLENPNLDSTADLLGLGLVLAFTGCAGTKVGGRDPVDFMKSRLDELLVFSFLCHYRLASEYVRTPRFESPPTIDKVPREALVNLDSLLEGTMRVEKTMSTAVVVPRPFSELVDSVLRADQNDEFAYEDLAQLIRKSLQTDMFALDEVNQKANSRSHFDQTSRTVTSTQLAEHRKLTVRQWNHLELLTKFAYRGANLRVHQDSLMAGSAIFCLQALRTAMIGFCTDCGPIVLGPVSDLLVLRDLRNVVISAICSRVQLENCRDVTLFVQTQTAPIVSRNCEGVKLASYNVFYDALSHELKHGRMKLMSQTENQWNRPVFVDAADDRVGGDWRSCAHLLPVDHFYVQPTPFAQTPDSAFYEIFRRSIPADYLESFEKRRAVAATWVRRNPEHKLIGISNEDRGYLQRRVTG